MKLKILFSFVLVLIFFTFDTSFAASVDPYSKESSISIANMVSAALLKASSGMMTMAITWLATFMMLQFTLTQISLLKSGADFEAIFAKLIGSLLWFGFCWYVLKEGPDFLDKVGTGVLNKFVGYWPTPGTIIASVLGVSAAIMGLIGVFGSSVAGFSNSSVGMVLVFFLLFVLAVGFYVSVKIFMLQLELGLIVMLSPLAFSFLGMNALKDQGIAPFKSLIALIYRVILMAIICSAFATLWTVAGDYFKGLKFDLKSIPTLISTVGDIVNIICSFIISNLILVFLIHKSDSIASSLASGSANLGTGDVAAAAAAGAAMGAAVATGGAALAKGSNPISKVLGNMMGKGSVSNASTAGDGGQSSPPPRPDPVSSSLGDSGNGGPPQRSDYESSGGKNSAQGKGQAKAANDAPPAPPGNASSAGVSGGSSGSAGGGNLEDKLGKLVDHLGKKPEPKSFGERAKDANQHIANEKATTSVSISTHHE